MKDKNKKAHKKRLSGEVVSNKMEKTVVVRVTRKSPHPLYRKIVTKSMRYKAHTEEKLEVGQVVEMEECRPLSRGKTWRVVKVVSK